MTATSIWETVAAKCLTGIPRTIDFRDHRRLFLDWQRDIAQIAELDLKPHAGDKDPRGRTLVRFAPRDETTLHRGDQFRVVYGETGALSLRRGDRFSVPLGGVEDIERWVAEVQRRYAVGRSMDQRKTTLDRIRQATLTRTVERSGHSVSVDFSHEGFCIEGGDRIAWQHQSLADQSQQLERHLTKIASRQ